ncbi:spore germination protein [Metabacillus endolithicus]|uniref:Spore germination protein n=1 Tax=Metabacillus endolithicus TaxID=1535204 RepID=A0ABW5C3Y5_9BACI
MGNFKVYSIAGTSSLVVGKGYYHELTSQTKTTNGVGSAYGDGSYINMSPYQSQVNDPDMKVKNSQSHYPYNAPSYAMNPYYLHPYPSYLCAYPVYK